MASITRWHRARNASPDLPRRDRAARRRRHLAGLALSLTLVTGCAGNRVTALVERHELTPATVLGGPFRHQLFLNRHPGQVLHVYLEGDGKAWVNAHSIARDPTPDRPLMLELLTLDPAPAIYLGRPCYYRTVDARCGPQWWTDRRYSEAVVASLDRVIDRFARDYRAIALFGHSGGGTLAMLLAARRTDVRAVVTLAGNLDIDAWAALHGYTPLRGSLNPRRQAPLSPAIHQAHYIGTADRVITAALLRQALGPQQRDTLRVVPGYDHACCWRDIWPAVLSGMDAGPAP